MKQEYRLIEETMSDGSKNYHLEVGGAGTWIWSAQNYNFDLSTLESGRRALAILRADAPSNPAMMIVSTRVIE